MENLPDIRHSGVRGSDLGIEDAGRAALGWWTERDEREWEFRDERERVGLAWNGEGEEREREELNDRKSIKKS